jgi:hypothetical protein
LSAPERSIRTMAVPTSEDERSVGENTGVIVGEHKCLFRNSECLAAARFGNFGPAVGTKSKVAYAGPGKRRTVRIAG